MDPKLIDDVLQVKGALGAFVLLNAAILRVMWQKLNTHETSLHELKEGITASNHRVELAVQKLTLWLESIKPKQD
jgi:hypothetical protein